MIHETAIVSSKAELHESVEVGPFAVIEDNVQIGEGTMIGSSALIASGARIGKNVKIHHGAVIGTIPQDLKFGGEETVANIGDNCVIREYTTVNRGTKESGSTDLGANGLMMAYAHVAHDCKVGDNVILANAVQLGGHVHIGDHVIIGGLVPVHQFSKIGCHAMIGGGFRLTQDLCPYSLAGGYPLKILGVNLIGLRRRRFSNEAIGVLRRVFKILFFSNLNTKQAVARINDEVEQTPEVQEILKFITESTRGLIK